VDRRSRLLTIDERYLWVIRRQRVIPFRWIHRIEYDFVQAPTSLRRGWDGRVRSGDEPESFRVGPVLRPRGDGPGSHRRVCVQRVPLFGCHGDGRGQAAGLDLEGQQEGLSRDYVDRLRALAGATFGNELPRLRDELGRAWSCEACRRPG